MSLLIRAPTRTETEPAPVSAAVPVIDDDIGYFRRKALRLKHVGIVAVGPTGLQPQPRQPTKADEVISAKRRSVIDREQRETVQAELAEIDRHRITLEARTAGLPGSYEAQELAAELRALAGLRAEIAADAAKPITIDREGRPVTDRMRAYLRGRTAELRESYWRAAEGAAREGDHRRARRLRRDALRARQVAEHEVGIRQHLPGY